MEDNNIGLNSEELKKVLSGEIKIDADKIINPLPESRSMYSPTSSQFDEGFIIPEEDSYTALEDYRASMQPNSHKIVNGVLKGLGTATTSFVENIGSIISVPTQMIYNAADDDEKTTVTQALYKNWLGNTSDAINDYLRKELPNYYSSAEKELGAFEQMIPGSGGALNFWSDKFLNGAGYFVGAAITPWGIESGLSKLGLKQATKNIIKNGADDILKASAGKTLGSAAELNNVFKIAGVGTLMSHGESAVESRQIFNETLEKLQQQKEKGLNNYTEEQMWDIATSVGNTGYLGNMMVTMPTNVLQFAKFIPGIEDMKFLNSSNKFLKPGKEFGEVLIEKPGIFSSLGKFTEGFIEEGGQELLQLGIQKGTQEYYLTKYDPESNFNWYNALQNSFIKATKELGSKEGLESIFLGGILGGPAQVIQGKSSDKSELLEATNVQNSFKNIKNSIQNLSTVAVARNENLNALKEDNTEKYYDSKDKEFKALVQTIEENGGTEILIKQLEDLKNSKGEDISNFLNLPNYLSDGTLRRKVDDIISLVKDYSSVHKNLKSKYSEFYNSEKGKPVFNVLYDAITGFRNINSRIAKLSLELSNLSQQELVFNELEFKENPEYRNEFLEKANDFVTEINKLNPDLTSEIIDKVKGLTYLSLTKRNEYLKDYSKALENPEEIIATAEQAQKNSNKENFEKETDTVKDEPVITPESLFGPEPTEEELKTSETPENIENSTPTEENEFLKLADNAVNEKELDAIIDQATQANKYTEELLQRIYNRRNILKQKEKLEKLVKDLEYSSIDELLKDINKNIFNNTKTKKEIAFLPNIEDLAKQAKNISNQIKEKELSASIEDDNDNEEKAGIYYDGEFDGAKPRTNFKTITREYLDKEDTIINKENTVLNFINWLRNFNVVDKNNFRFLAITAKNNKKLHDILISDPKFSGTEGVFMVLATENENGEWVPVKLDEEENRKNYIFTGILTDRTINDSLEDAEEYRKWRQSLLDSTEPVVVSIQNKSKGVYSTVKIFDEALDKYVRAKRNVLGTISNLETFSDIDLHIGIKEGETIYGNFRVPKNGVGRLYVTKLGSNENPISIPVDLISRTLEQKEVNTAYEIIRSLMNPVKNQDSKKLLKALKALIVLKADDTNLNYRIGFKENKFDTIIVADKEFTKDNLDEQFIKSFLSNKKFNASNDYILKENPNQPFTTVEIDNAGILIDKEYINYKDYLFSNKGREQAPFTTDVATYDKNNAPTEDAIGKTTAEYPKGLYIIFDPTIVSLNNTVNTKNQTLSSESNTNTNPEPIPTIPVTPITELDKLNAEVVRLVNIRNNDKTVRQAIIDSNNGKITLEELDAITKKWDDENGLTAAIKAYDAEKKKQSAPAVPVSDKKADIERRIVELQKRLDEDKYEKEKEDILNSLTKGFLPTGFRFGSLIGIIEKYISEEDRWISVVDNIMALDKDPIKAIDKYFNQQGLGQKISNANTEYKKQIKPFEEKEEQEDKDITNEQIKLLSTKEGILIRKDWSLGKGLGYTGEGTNGIVEIDEDKNGNKFEAEYYLTGENDEWIESSYFLGKTKQEVIDKINAKYDTELGALEGKSTEEVKLIPTTPVSDIKAKKADNLKRGDIITFQLEEYQVERVTENSIDIRSIKTGDTDVISKEDYNAELDALEGKPNKDISENIPTPLSKYYSKESLTEKPDLGITSEQPSIEELKKKRFSKKDDSFESPDKLDMVAKPGKPIDIEKEIAWFKSKLGFSPEIINDLIENYSLGRVIYYGKTLISDKAIEGTAYHEAFHNVSQFLLTDKELSLLYSEARNKYPNLTDLEIEEILAEDFRKYKLNGKILDKEPIKKSLFDKILQFIKNLLNLNATSLQEVYERLDSGFYSGKKQVNNSSLLQSKKIRELNKTNVLTEKFIQDVISTIDVKIGNVLLTGDRKNYSPDQLVDLSNNLNKTLNTIYNEFIDDYDSLLNKETLSKQEESQVYNLYTILDNWSDIENIYKEDLSTFGLDIEEDVDEQKITNRSNDFSEKKNDVNPKENISKNTRFLIRFLPKMEFYRNPLTKKLDTKKVINDLGYPTSVEFNEVFGKLLNNLSDSPSGDFESFYNKLLDLSKTDATIRELTNRIKKPQDTISEEDIDLQSSILQDINRHKTNAKILNYQSDGNVFIVDANRQGLENQIQESWRQNIKNKINDRRKGFFPRTLLKENPLIYKEEIEQFKNKVLPLSKTNDIDDKFKFLEEFGIILSKPTKDIIKDPDTNIKISKIFNNAIRELEIALEPNKLGTYDLDIKDILSTTSTALGRIQDLLEIEAAFNTKLVEFSYLNSENETEYSLELFNYFSNVASIINDQNIKTKTELFEKLPHLKSVTNKNSSWLNAMFNLKEERVPNVKILINYANGSKITNNSNSGKLTSSLNEPEKIIQDFNMLLLDGISSSIRAADASSEYTVNLNNFKSGTSRQHLPIPISNFNKNLNDIVELKTIFKGYFLDELNRIIEYKNGLGSNIKVFNKEGGKWDIFSEMSDELKTIIESKIEEKEDSISIYNSLQEPINDYIVNFLENEINNYKDKLDFFNIITDPFNTGVSTKLLRDENNQIKYSIDSLISAFIVNDYINSVEQLKLFFGDLAFYKDFFKRTKGAIGTKSMPRNDKYINDWFAKYYESNPRLDGKIKDLDKINVAIVSDIKIKSLYTDNYFKIINDNFGKELAQETKNLFENTNEPDGQGLFMPDECYMFRKKLGKMPRAEKNQWMYEFAWTRNDRKLYTDKQKEEGLPEKDIQLIKNYEDKIKTGKIEEYPLQVIKAQYFGPSYNVSNLFSPTFHKYSLLPLTWRLVKGTNLEEQYLRMEKQQIGYLVFDSVVKVGNVLNKENKQDTFYDSEGNISKKEFTPQIISYNFLGEQVKVSLPKDKVTFGTQMRKLIWGHLFNEGTAINNKFQNYLNKYTDLNNSLINLNKTKLLKDLGIIPEIKKSDEIEKDNQIDISILDLRNNPIDYTEGQKKALSDIEKIINKPGDGYYLLAGYAGTGKTTIAENIAKYGKESGKSILVVAPTNKAAKVLNDKLKSTGVESEAQTIHKTIYGEPDPITGEWIPSANIKNSVIIVDESSMIEDSVMQDLLKLTKDKNNKIIFMGDSFQLEAVGKDSGLFQNKIKEIDKGTELTEVKRQSLDSNILKIATLIREDKKSYIPEISTEDFIVAKSKNEFVENFKSSIKNNEDSIMIVATNNERILMNKLARDAKFGENSKNILNENENLISIANSTDYSNSETFSIKKLNDTTFDKFTITLKDNFNKESNYDVYFTFIVNDKNIEIPMLFLPEIDKPSLYHSSILQAARESNKNLYNALEPYTISSRKGIKLSPNIIISTYGYSITAHKSQGSQWEKVFVNQNYSAPTWNPARWFYTAITRAAKQVEVLPSSYNTLIKNEEINEKINNLIQSTEQQGSARKTYSGKITSLQSNQIFVFGSNPEGRHGAGAAKDAKDLFGAKYGQGRGMQGQSYALVTKNLKPGFVEPSTGITYKEAGEKSVSKEQIIENIKELYSVAKENTSKEFLIPDYSKSNLNGYTGQEMADMFNAAGPIPSNIVFNENFDKLIGFTQSDIETSKELDEPVLPEIVYSQKNVTKLVNMLREEAVDRNLAKNIIDAFDTETVYENGKKTIKLRYYVDSMVNRNKVNSLLTSIINNRLIKQKINGDAMVQAANTGWESIGKRNISTSNFLKFYRESKEGDTLPAEVMQPVGKNYKPLLEKYGTLDKLNSKIEQAINLREESLEALQANEELNDLYNSITIVGYRIPTQGTNSIEYMIIRKFLPGASNTIILPSEITTKSGGDFDIDKLNVFRKKIIYDELNKGKLNIINNNNIEEIKNFLENSIKELNNYTENLELDNLINQINPVFSSDLNGKLTKEYVNLLKNLEIISIQNEIINLYEDILKSKENLKNLIIPNSTSIFSSMFDKLDYSKKETSKNKSIGYVNKLKQFYQFMSGKAGVGIGAVNSTFNVLAQVYGLYITPKYEIAPNKYKYVNVNLPHDLNISKAKTVDDKYEKSEVFNQDVNITVDVARNPELVFDLNLGEETAGIFMFLTHIGVNPKVSIAFLNQPIIKKYLNDISSKINMASQAKNQNFSKTQIQKSVLDEIVYDYNLKLNSIEDKKFEYLDFKSMDSENVLTYLINFIKNRKENQNNYEYIYYQIQFLKDFVNYKEYSNLLRDNQSAVNFDTAGLDKDLFQSIFKLNDVSNTIKLGFIPNISKIINNSFISNFNQHKFAIDVFSSLYYVHENKDVEEALISFSKLISYKPDETIDKIVSDYINFVVQRYGEYKDQKISDYRLNLMTGENSLPKRIQQIKNKPTSELSSHDKKIKSLLFIKEIFPQFDNKDENSGVTTDNLKFFSRKIDTKTNNRITESLKELQSIDIDLYNDIVIMGMLQSGVRNSPITYYGVLNHEVVGNIIKESFKNQKENNKFAEDLKIFMADFLNNNYRFDYNLRKASKIDLFQIKPKGNGIFWRDYSNESCI